MAALDVLKTIRATYPTPLGNRHGAFLLEAAAALGMGLYRKESGTHVVLPDGTRVSQDILIATRGGASFDVLSDGEGAAEPMFSQIDTTSEADRFYAVVPTVPDPPDPDPIPPQGLDEVLALLKGIDATVDALRAELEVAKNLQQLGYADLVKRLEAQQPVKFPTYKGKILGLGVTLDPQG